MSDFLMSDLFQFVTLFYFFRSAIIKYLMYDFLI